MEGEKNIIALQRLEGNDPTHLKGLQVPLEPFVGHLMVMWWIIFFGTLLFVLYKGARQVLAERK